MVEGAPRNVFVREDVVTGCLGALLIRAAARPGVPLEEVDVPRGPGAQVAACREAGLRLSCDPVRRLLSTEIEKEKIVLRL